MFIRVSLCLASSGVIRALVKDVKYAQQCKYTTYANLGSFVDLNSIANTLDTIFINALSISVLFRMFIMACKTAEVLPGNTEFNQ